MKPASSLRECHSTLQSLRAAGAWKKTRHVLQRSRSAGLQPGVLTYNNCLLKRTPWESALELLETIFRQATPEVTTYNAMITRLRGAWCKGFLMFHQLNFIALQADILSFNSALALLPWRSALDLHSNTASLTASSLRLDGISFGSVQQSLCSAPWPLGLVLTERATASATALMSWSRNIAATSATTASGWWLALLILGRSDDLLGMNLALHAATSASQWQDVLMTFEGAKAGGLRREPDVVSKGTLINALDLAQEWRFAFAVLVDGRTTTNTMCYNSASSSAAKTGHWQVSCQLLLSMSSASFEADLISFNAAASFGTSAVGRWAMASTVLQRAQEVSCRLSEVSFGASVVSAEWPRALAVMDVLRMEIQLRSIAMLPSAFVQAQPAGAGRYTCSLRYSAGGSKGTPSR